MKGEFTAPGNVCSVSFAPSAHQSKTCYVNMSSCTTGSHIHSCAQAALLENQLFVLCRNSSAGDHSLSVLRFHATDKTCPGGWEKGIGCSLIPSKMDFLLTNTNMPRSFNAPQVSGIYSEHSLLLAKRKAGRDFQCPSQHCSLPQGPKEEKLEATLKVSQSTPELFSRAHQSCFRVHIFQGPPELVSRPHQSCFPGIEITPKVSPPSPVQGGTSMSFGHEGSSMCCPYSNVWSPE